MALISTNNIKNSETAVTNLTLDVPANQSIRIWNIHVESKPDAYATTYIESQTCGYFRTSSTVLGNHIPFIKKSSKSKTILGVLREKGIFTGYPLEAGSKFIIKNTVAARMSIEYDIYSPGDIKPDQENGIESKTSAFLMYGQPLANVSTGGDTQITKRNNPTEFCNFPFVGPVSTGKKIQVYGLIYSSRGADNGAAVTNYIHTTYLKMMKGRNVLFDSDRKGLIAQGKNVVGLNTFEAENGYDVGGEGTDLYEKGVLFFDNILEYNAGEELDTHWGTEVATTPGTFLAAELEICYILKETQI